MARRPALAAVEQVVRHLAAAETIARVSDPDPRVRLFQLDGAAGRCWIGWLAPSPIVLPGDPVPAVDVIVGAPAGPVVLERVAGSGPPTCSFLAPATDTVIVPLSPSPVFVTAGADTRCTPHPRRRLRRS